MIHVGFPLYDSKGTYSKYEAVALLSLLSNTSSTITVHIIHDDSVSETAKDKLKRICGDFQQKIMFHLVNPSDFSSLVGVAKGFTIGTLFRLKLPELMDNSIQKILFLDADLLINTDIKAIWDLDVSDFYVAACHDDGLEDFSLMMSDGLVPASKYYNAGVVVFNLKKIRQDFDLFNDSADFLLRHSNCPYVDQDAANYFFMDNVLYLEQKYNMFTRNKRGLSLPLEDGIYHYAGDYVCLDAPEEFDRKYMEYMSLIHWDNGTGIDGFLWGYVGREHCRITALQLLCARVSDRNVKIVLWGTGSTFIDRICSFVNRDRVDYYVDNNSSIQGTIFNEKKVEDPTVIKSEANVFVVVVSKIYYAEIKEQLESYGLVENIHFVDGLSLLLQSQGGRASAY